MTPNLQKDLSSLKRIYTALMLGVVSFGLIATVLGPFLEQDPMFEKILLSVSTLMAVASILAGIVIFRKQTQGIRSLNLDKKISKYRSAMIIRAATMEGSCFFFIICYLISSSPVFMIEVSIVLAFMFYFFPTNSRLAEEMKHSFRELEMMQKK